jgi:spermidine synthase
MPDASPSGRPRVWIAEDEGQRALFVDGVVQSVAVDAGDFGPGYWPSMLPDVRPRRALLLGLGAGTIAHLLVRRFGAVPMVGVDDDAEVIAIGCAQFRLALPSLTIVEADAVDYVARCTQRFDYVCVDVYRAAELDRRVLARPTLRRLKALAMSHGLVVFNLFRDGRTVRRHHRIQQIFRSVVSIPVGKNVVVRCTV